MLFLGTYLTLLKFPPLGGNSGHELYLGEGEVLLFEAILRIAVFLLLGVRVLSGWKGLFLKNAQKKVNF